MGPNDLSSRALRGAVEIACKALRAMATLLYDVTQVQSSGTKVPFLSDRSQDVTRKPFSRGWVNCLVSHRSGFNHSNFSACNDAYVVDVV